MIIEKIEILTNYNISRLIYIYNVIFYYIFYHFFLYHFYFLFLSFICILSLLLSTTL